MGSTDFLQHIIDIEKEIKPARWPGCYIYKIPDSLRELNKDAYSPLLISIGPVHHGKERLEGMQEQKHRYFSFFRERLKNESDLKRYKTFLEGKEQSIRHCYQQEFSDGIKKEVKVDDNKKEVEVDDNKKEVGEPFLSIILLDAVFIMELFLREVEAREDKEHEDDYIITRPYLSKIVRRDLLLLENQLPIYVLDELYDYVPCKAKKHTRFLRLAHEYFKCVYPDPKPPEERMFEPKWEKSLHFTDLIRRSCLPMKPSYDNDMSHHLCCRSRATSVGYGHRHSSQKECMLRTATKLNEAGISFEKVSDADRCLLDIRFVRKPFFNWFLCLGCLPHFTWFKARLQFPQLKVDHTTECVLRNLIAFEQCHYPDKPYICNYVSLVDSLIHTKDDAELLVEKEAIVHELGSDKELATLVNSLCKHVVTNKTCYHQIIGDLHVHYNNPWKWAMGTLRWVYFRDPWRSSSTIVGIAVLIFTIFNFCRVIRVVF